MKNVFIFLAAVLFSLEAAGYAATFFARDLYLNTPLLKFVFKVTQEELDHFSLYNRVEGIGWKGAFHIQTDNGIAGPFYERPYTGYKAEEVRLMTVGDSYTYGSEIPADAAIAPHIFRRSGIQTANLGLPGGDPLQAFLYAKKAFPSFPQTKVVVLNIMYENILRMVNSYRFTYGDMKATHHERFSFRPYMKDGKLIPLEPHVFSSLDNLYKAAEDAFAKDFWAKPKAQFPYSVAFIKALSSHAFTIPLTMRWERQKRHEFLSQYKDPYLGKNLLQVITWFSEWAAENNITPVVFFVPMNKFDITSPQIWIDTYKDRLPGNLIIRNVDFSRIKPNNYNLSTGRRHPTPYGADALAAQIVDIVQPLVLP